MCYTMPLIHLTNNPCLPPLPPSQVLDILQKVFYRSNPAREAFVELCEDSYVQKMTFDSYLYKVGKQGQCRFEMLSGKEQH
jgi:hypothetical protein